MSERLSPPDSETAALLRQRKRMSWEAMRQERFEAEERRLEAHRSARGVKKVRGAK